MVHKRWTWLSGVLLSFGRRYVCVRRLLALDSVAFRDIPKISIIGLLILCILRPDERILCFRGIRRDDDNRTPRWSENSRTKTVKNRAFEYRETASKASSSLTAQHFTFCPLGEKIFFFFFFFG
jgi:hypothetical protein